MMEQQKERKNGRKEGRKEGKKEGYASGKRKTKIEVIERMLNDNLDIEMIKKYANATDEEIKEARTTK